MLTMLGDTFSLKSHLSTGSSEFPNYHLLAQRSCIAKRK